jgi:hypothetical protein
MNELSKLTYSTLLARMRPDLFSGNVMRSNAGEHVSLLERCDSCGRELLLNQVRFTGSLFLCATCERIKAHQTG